MKLTYVGKKMTVGDDLKAMAQKKLGALDKYFHGNPEVTVTFSHPKNHERVDVTVRLPKTMLRAEETADTFQTALDRCVDALERQMRKYKTKLKKHHSAGSESLRFEQIEDTADRIAEDQEPEVVRTKQVPVKPMDVEEAILQMELLGHNFFVFADSETQEIQVVYKRKDGGFGLIIPSI